MTKGNGIRAPWIVDEEFDLAEREQDVPSKRCMPDGVTLRTRAYPLEDSQTMIWEGMLWKDNQCVAFSAYGNGGFGSREAAQAWAEQDYKERFGTEER